MKEAVHPTASGRWSGPAGLLAGLALTAALAGGAYLAGGSVLSAREAPGATAGSGSGAGRAAGERGRLVFVFLDVGDGDSIFIRTPNDKCFLIDGGPGGSQYTSFDAGSQRVLPFLRRHGVSNLDGLVLTHAHNDHIGGLLAVLDDPDLTIGRIYDPGLPYASSTYERFLVAVKERAIPWQQVREGDLLDWDPSVLVQVLNPEARLVTGSRSDPNTNSIALRIAYDEFSALLAADVEEQSERSMLGYGDGLRSTLLKVPHHGSEFSSSWPFLQAVAPQTAIITCGARNRFGHPHAATIERLTRLGVRLLRTDRHGDITVVTDGRRHTVVPAREP